MGCTSGKAIKKKTTSVEDVSQQKNVNTNAVSPNKNGQIGQGKQPKVDSSSNAIQIPGANKSFLAPDGIPFIDEDVESDTEGGFTSETQIPNAKSGSPSDQNKNIITSNKTVTTTREETKTSALSPSDPQHGGGVTTTSRVVTVESSHHGGDNQHPGVISEIMEQEMRQTSAANTASANTHDTSKTSVEVSDDSDASRQQQVAATKIQAGIRGFLDRKKVKAIRANQQNAAGQTNHGKESVKNQSGYDDRQVLIDVRQTNDETDPKLHTAATKIQANYKGYKTRKQLNVHKK